MHHPDFYSDLFEVVRNLKEYNSYQGKVTVAIKNLLMKHPQITRPEITQLLNQGIKFYDEALILLKQYPGFHSADEHHLPENIKKEFFAGYPEFPSDFHHWVTGWIYHWYFER